jgi:RNA polymerase sigma factor (sigma-70 family)
LAEGRSLMLSRQQRVVLPRLCKLMRAQLEQDLSDRQLLERFLARGDGAAFAALVRRHGRTVLGVCQRVLNNVHDAEDAFQATFLVLVRRARCIAKREAVGSWLYGVASRVALKARAEAVRRRKHEGQAARTADHKAPPGGGWDEVRPIIDEEVNRLPEKYRQPIVLCYFEGKTYEEAARLLGWPAGTASARLARARNLLRSRLIHRGVALSCSAFVAGLHDGAASAAEAGALADATANAALRFAADPGTAAISSKVVALAEGVLKAMLMRTMKSMTAVVVAVSIMCAGAGVLCRWGITSQASAADHTTQAAKASAGPVLGEAQVADAARPPGPPAQAQEHAAEVGAAPPPQALAPPAHGPVPLHTRIGLINLSRVFKAARQFQASQAELRKQTKAVQQKLEALKSQLQRLKAESDDPATKAPARQQNALRMLQLKREIEDEEASARAKLEKVTGASLTKMYRQVEDAANRIAKARGLELVMFYADAVTEADFYNPNNLQRKLTQPGALMPMVVAPGMDITEAVIEVVDRTAPAGSRP